MHMAASGPAACSVWGPALSQNSSANSASPPNAHRGFDYSGGSWSTLVGKPGLYPLYTDGAGVKLTATIAGGGTDSKSLFIRAVQLTRGSLATTTTLSKVGASWQTTGEGGCCSSGDADCVWAACARREPSSAAIVALHVKWACAPVRYSLPADCCNPTFQLAVMAMGKKVPSAPPAVLGSNITVRVGLQPLGGRSPGRAQPVQRDWAVVKLTCCVRFPL